MSRNPLDAHDLSHPRRAEGWLLCGVTENPFDDDRLLDAEAELATLRDALESRLVIGQAMGLLMARQGLSTDAAFEALARQSQETNVKLRDVAARLVADAQPEASR